MDSHNTPHMANSQKPMSPQTSYSSESEKTMPQSSGKKRPSRAGTRSVSTLTAAQLERKRANDREAQRAIRQRTKEHIENLERRITELTTNDEGGSKMLQVMQRNQELEQENAILRSRLGQAVGVYSQEGQGIGGESSMITARSPPGAMAMPQPRLSSTPAPRVASMTPGVSQGEHWQHPSHSAAQPSSIGAPSSADSASWAQHQHGLPHPLGHQDGSQHVSQTAPSNYGYPVQYQPSEQVPIPYEQQAGHASTQYPQMEYQRSMPPDITQQPTAAYPGYQSQSYMQQTSQMPHSQNAQLYNIAPNMKPRP